MSSGAFRPKNSATYGETFAVSGQGGGNDDQGLKNLGALKQAEFSLGDMTIICGGNNTGKTYATYALFGFLYRWREGLHVPVSDHTIDQLLADGTVHIPD